MRFCRGADPRGCAPHSRDWNLSDDELETVMQRLDDAFVYMAHVTELFPILSMN